MDNHPARGMLRAALWVLLAAVSWTTGAQAQEYLSEDVYLSGKQIHGFDDGGKNVTVVLGDFTLSAGKRSVRGRDAVLWTDEKKVGQ
ncbi:MAG: hypothetical protein ACLFV7_13660, partial [Phycisphaerae bacterium]